MTIRLRNVPDIDTFTFYDPQPPTLPGVPTMVSIEQTYVRSGSPRRVRPISTDPTSPFNWAGEMWKATASIRFSAAYTDGSFSVQGEGNSSPTDFGQMGFEHNGVFLQDEA